MSIAEAEFIKQCPYCGKERHRNGQSYSGHYSYCKRKHEGTFRSNFTDYARKHGAWNRGLTADTDERVRKSREALSVARKGMRHSLETKRVISFAHKGKHLSPEAKRKLSLTRIRKIASGEIVPPTKGKHLSLKTRNAISLGKSRYIEEHGGKGFPHVKAYDAFNLKGDQYKVRGTWELKLSEKLNSLNVLWVRKVYLRYGNRNYTPDFYLPDCDIYLEVKGHMMPGCEEKMKMAVLENKVVLYLVRRNVIDALDDIKSLQDIVNMAEKVEAHDM